MDRDSIDDRKSDDEVLRKSMKRTENDLLLRKRNTHQQRHGGSVIPLDTVREVHSGSDEAVVDHHPTYKI